MKRIILKNIKDVNQVNVRQASPISYLIHKLSGAGKFELTLLKGVNKINSCVLICDSHTEVDSVNIDLFELATEAKFGAIHINSEFGYLLFYNSQNFEDYRVVIKKDKTVEYDSYQPKKGDLFSVNLLKAGEYAIESKQMQKRASLSVDQEVWDQTKLNVAKSYMLNKAEIIKGAESKISTNQGFTIDLEEGMEDLTISLKKEFKVASREQLKASLKNELRKQVKMNKELIRPKYRLTKPEIKR